MSDLEIYDSSESQLSSDEYSQDGDDETLMNVAVIKQRNSSEKTPPSSTSNNTSPAKSSSAGTSTSVTPVKKTLDGYSSQKSVPPPANREQTERQNKCLQRQSKAYLYYRRRSIRWLKQKSTAGYLEDLKAAVMAVRHREARMAQYREAKRAIEMELQSRQRKRERTPSRSPDLICLDDTENEESPEKPNEVTASVKLMSRKASVDTMEAQKLHQEKAETYEHLSEDKLLTIENGSELDEFLTLKPSVPKPAVNIQTACDTLEIVSVGSVIEIEKELELVSSTEVLDAFNAATKTRVNQSTKAQLGQTIDMPLEATITTLKRRRSLTPPSGVEAIDLIDKRIKTMPASETNSIIEIMPKETTTTQEQQLEQQPQELRVIYLDLPTEDPMEINYASEQTQPTATVSANHYNEANASKKPVVTTHSFTQSPAAEARFATPMQSQSSVSYQQPKQRVEHVSRQTQTAQMPAEERNPRVASKSTANASTAISADLNNTDAMFHNRIKDMFSELDAIMDDKVRSIKPEIKSYGDEKVRIQADIKTLDNLIKLKEEEHNRLLHLRYVKEELLSRVERKERVLIMKEVLPSIFNKNCSTTELYEMHALLVSEQSGPTPTRYNKSVMEQFISKIERNQEDIKTWRSALGLKESPRPPVPAAAHYENNLQHNLHRRNSMPSMSMPPPLPPPPPPPSAAYGRQGAVLDVRSLIEDYRREHPEGLPLVGKRAKQQAMPSRYELTINSTPNLAASCSNLQHAQRSQRSSFDNNFDTDMLQPLYNSSPLAADAQQRRNSDSHSRVQPYNAVDSIFDNNTELARAQRLLQKLERKATKTLVNCNDKLNKSLLRTATNGPDASMERRCQQCQRQEATYMCSGCKNQWYCSRECQLHAWDTHWEKCM